MQVLGSIIGIVVGFLVIKYTFPLVNTFGTVGWAEQHLGSGGTYTMYKIAGLIIIIISFLNMFGGVGFLVSPLAPLFGAA